jgi:hypothetical protein
MCGDAIGFPVHPTDNKEICGIARVRFPASRRKLPTNVANSQQYSDFGRRHDFDHSDEAQKA